MTMKPHWSDGQVTLYHGDCLNVLPSLPAESVDAVITDPPYGLRELPAKDIIEALTAWLGGDRAYVPDGKGGFMNKDWDTFVPPPAAWDECLRVLKPGGWLLCFAGTRTMDLMTLPIRLAGFEIRDALADLTGIDGPGLLWLYGQGAPKSLDVSKAIDKAAGATREVVGDGHPFGRGSLRNRSRVEMGYRPTELNPDGGIAQVTIPATEDATRWDGWGTALKPAWEPIIVARKPFPGTVAQNVLAHGTGALNVDACRVPHAGPADLAESEGKNRHRDFGSGPRRHKGVYAGQPADDRAQYDGSAGRWPPNILLGKTAAREIDRQSGATVSHAGKPRVSAQPGTGWGMTHTGAEYDDAGGASRFFPCFRYAAKAGTNERPRLDDGTEHPTVKPQPLIEWLCRLVVPPGGTVLDPHAGTGPVGEAAVIQGFKAILVDKDPDAVALTLKRLSKDIQPDIFSGGDAA